MLTLLKQSLSHQVKFTMYINLLLFFSLIVENDDYTSCYTNHLLCKDINTFQHAFGSIFVRKIWLYRLK